MKNNVIYIALFLSFLLPQSKKVIAVANIESTGLSKVQEDMFFQQFESKLVQTQYYTVTSRSEVDKILKEQEFQKAGCTDQECAAEIGKLLNADYMLLSEIIFDKEGSFLSVTLKLVEVLTAEIKTSRAFTENESNPYSIFPKIPDYLMELIESQDDIYQAPIQGYSDKKEYGYLNIITSPKGMTIKIDGDKLRNKTPIDKYKLSVGKHKVVIYSEDHERTSLSVNVLKDSTIIKNFEMLKKQGLLLIYTSVPSANININNAFIGTTSKKIAEPYEYESEVGKYELTIQKEFYKTVSQKIKISGEPMEITIDLEPKPVNVEIITKPNSVNGTVYINGKREGKKPYDGSFDIKLLPDTYIVSVEAEGFSKEETITIIPGKYEEIELKLKKSKNKKKKREKYEGDNLIGAGFSYGYPAQANFNLRFTIKNINFEYANDVNKLSHNNFGLNKLGGNILGKQYSIGTGNYIDGFWNIFYGYTQYSGKQAFPALYALDNTIYEYWGISRKKYGEFFNYEIGLNWGDEDFNAGKGQLYIQLGAMIKYSY